MANDIFDIDRVLTRIMKFYSHSSVTSYRVRKYQWLRNKKSVPRFNCLYKKKSVYILGKNKLDRIKYYSMPLGDKLMVLGRPKLLTSKGKINEYIVPMLWRENLIYIRMSEKINPRKLWKKIPSKT